MCRRKKQKKNRIDSFTFIVKTISKRENVIDRNVFLHLCFIIIMILIFLCFVRLFSFYSGCVFCYYLNIELN